MGERCLMKPASQILRMQLSNEEDLFFLHSMEVSEEEFQNLKLEQGILVDFANFPGKIVGLLERCLASKLENVPQYASLLTPTRWLVSRLIDKRKKRSWSTAQGKRAEKRGAQNRGDVLDLQYILDASKPRGCK